MIARARLKYEDNCRAFLSGDPINTKPSVGRRGRNLEWACPICLRYICSVAQACVHGVLREKWQTTREIML
jgi:hypothetical protein